MDVKDALQSGGIDNINVYVRIRPSKDSQERICAFATSNSTIKLDSKVLGQSQQPSAARGEEGPKSFTFDFVARSDVSQESFFDRVGRPMAESCLHGYNGCIFAYGQTGSGKTFTIQGPDGPHSAEDKGLTVRILEFLFRKLQRSKRDSPNFDFMCECSYLELYQENLQDLMAVENKKLELREDLKKGVYVDNMTKIAIRSAEDAEGLFLNGTKRRHVASSKANNQSSRSHAIFTIYIQTQEINETGVTAIKSSMLHIVDLAGSERQKNTEASGTRLQEAGMINRSLTHLGKTIRALVDQSENKHVYVPYRESKLTFLLKQSLGGNSKTAIIATVDPGLRSYSETLSTLRFADRAKMIRNNAVVNEQSTGSVTTLQAELKRLRADYQALLKTTSSSSLNIALNGSGNHVRASSSSSSSGSGNTSGSSISPRDRPSSTSSTQVSSLERDETIYRLEDLLRAMASQVKNASIERDNFSHKIRELQQLLVVKEYQVESSKLIARLKEEKIARIQRCGEDEAYLESIKVSDDEIAALQCEIEALQHQLSHHPDVIRLSIENMELREILEHYEAHYKPEGELAQLRSLCDKLSTQLIKLSTDKAKLIELLKGEEDASSTGSGSGSSGTSSPASSSTVTMSKLTAWSHEVKVEQLQAEIEHLRVDALRELSVSEEKDLAHRMERDDLKFQLKTMQEQVAKMEAVHQEEKEDLEARYHQLSAYIRDQYETQIKALHDRLEHEHVSSVTVLTMEKQLSTQTDEYVQMKKQIFDMQNDLRALKNVLEASYIPIDLDAELGVEPIFASENLGSSGEMASNDESFDATSVSLLYLSTPKKSVIGAGSSLKTPSKSPWTPNRSIGSLGAMTPSGGNAISIPRLAIAKIQELHSMVTEYTSKIAELENTLAEIDGEHFAITKKQKDKLRDRKLRIEELEGVVVDYQERDNTSRERLEELGTQLDLNNQLLEEREAEAEKARYSVESLQRQVAALNSEKDTLKAQTTALVTQLKQQKDDQVLAMMKRQDELEAELLEARQLFDDEVLLNKELQSRLDDTIEHSANAESMLTQTRTLVDSLTSDVSRRDEKIKSLKGQLADTLAEQESLHSRLRVLESAEDSLQEIQRENDELTSSMKESCRALREKQNQLLHLEELRRRETLELEQEKDIAARAFEQLQSENDTLAQQLNQTHNTLRNAQASLTSSEKRVTELSHQLSIEQTRVTEFKQEISSLQHHLTTERAKNMKMEEKLAESTQELLRLSQERETLSSDLDEAVSSLEAKSEQLNMLLTDGTEEEKALRIEKDDLTAELKVTRTHLQRARDELTASSSELFEAHERMADSETMLETMIEQQKSEISSLRQTLAADRRSFEENNGRYIQENLQMSRQLKELTMRRDKDSEEHAARVARLEENIERLSTDRVVKARDATIDDLRAQLEQMRTQNESLRSELYEFESFVAQKSSELLDAKSEAADLASQKHNKIQYVQTMKSENNKLRKEADELRAKLRLLEIASQAPSSSSTSLTPAPAPVASSSSSNSSPTASSSSSSSSLTSSYEETTRPAKRSAAATSKPATTAKATTAAAAAPVAPAPIADITNNPSRRRTGATTATTTATTAPKPPTRGGTLEDDPPTARPTRHTRSSSQRNLDSQDR